MYPSTMTETSFIALDLPIYEVSRDECLEMGICYKCSPTFESILEDGMCRFCDDDKWERKTHSIPDDACWWEKKNGKLYCGTDSMCPCRSYFEMELFKKKEWEKDLWPGGTCSRAYRDIRTKLRESYKQRKQDSPVKTE
jgi:hypothetical protein